MGLGIKPKLKVVWSVGELYATLIGNVNCIQISQTGIWVAVYGFPQA